MHGVSHDKLNSLLNKEAAITHGGLGIITAGVFLAGEMAGSGVLALPYAMLGTGMRPHLWSPILRPLPP